MKTKTVTGEQWSGMEIVSTATASSPTIKKDEEGHWECAGGFGYRQRRRLRQVKGACRVAASLLEDTLNCPED